MLGASRKKVVAIIPARGNSKRLTRKNLRSYLGKPMLQWAIEASQAAQLVDEVYVSTEDQETAALAREAGVLVIDRPAYLAEDHVWTQDVLRHAVEYLEERKVPIDIIVRIQANSPQVEAAKIDEAVDKLDRYGLWEVFSVNEDGLEDAAIHVLQKKCVWQAALSVYKGVVTTDYIDVHDLADLTELEMRGVDKIERQSIDFLNRLERRYLGNRWQYWYRWLTRQDHDYYLWRWQRIIPLRRRWAAILNASLPLRQLLSSADAWQKTRDLAVLDLGCGFGMYWPVMKAYGFRKFVGVDLYDLRRQEHYRQATKAYVDEFCEDCSTQVIMDDARRLNRHELLFKKFDIILAVATTSTKSGSTGISRDLFDKIVEQYGSEDCIPVFVERVPGK